jgi:hypothetical protein
MGAHKIKGKTLLGQMIGTNPMTTPNASLKYTPKVEQIKRLEIGFSGVAVTMTDGTTNGSIGSISLGTFHAKRLSILGASTNIAMVGAGGVVATATVKHSVGTVAVATNDTLDGTEADIIASTNTVLVASAGTASGRGGTPLAVPASEELFLNFGIADAGSTGNGTLTLTGSLVLEYVELD